MCIRSQNCFSLHLFHSRLFQPVDTSLVCHCISNGRILTMHLNFSCYVLEVHSSLGIVFDSDHYLRTSMKHLITEHNVLTSLKVYVKIFIRSAYMVEAFLAALENKSSELICGSINNSASKTSET